MLKKVFLSVIFLFIMFTLTGYTKEEENLLESKIEMEILNIENNIFDMVYKIATGEYEERITPIENMADIELTIVNFDEIKKDIMKINNMLDVTVYDTIKGNYAENTILDIRNNTNKLILNLKEENINVVLKDLNELEKTVSKNDLKKRILDVYTESMIYEDKTNSKEKMNSLMSDFENKSKDEKFLEENKYTVNNVYILLQEFKNAIESENEDLINLKYIELLKII